MSGFDEKICTLVPNKHQALDTLKDNTNYIRSALDIHYEETKNQEPEPAKNPYELARQAMFYLARSNLQKN